MSTQLLFYRQVVPLSAERHRELSVKSGTDYAFARTANSVPLTLGEMPIASAEYCIVFAGSEEEPMPVAILGAAKDENLYVDADGHWTANYIPAFVRRYPFVFSRSEDGKTFTLCVDEEFSGCNRDGRGERLFDADGERTTYLQQVLQFQQAYQAENQRTQAFCRRLAELGLLTSIQAQIKPASGENRLLTGARVVDRAKLKALDTEKLAAMAKSDELELIYLHLHSLQNLRRIGERIPGQPVPETAPGEPGPTADHGEGSSETTH